MRRTCAIQLALLIVLPITIGSAQALSAPPAGIVFQIVGDEPGHILATTWCGVSELVDGEPKWHDVPGLQPGVGEPLRYMVELKGGIVLAASGWNGTGVWRHTPSGAWQRVLDG